MKVAITGGTGFLGKEVVSMLDRDTNYTPIIIGREAFIENIKNEYRSTDYSKQSLDTVLKDIDAVIHLAAKRGANGSISDFHANEIITENLFSSCACLEIKNIVFASSISVYSDVTKIPWTEEQLPYPKNLYGVSKVACEYIGDLYHKKYDLNIKSLRIAHIIGDGEQYRGMMNIFIDNAFEKKTLKVNGKSIAKREFVYVKDVARAIKIAVSKPEIHDVFNVGSGEAYTNLEIAQIVNEVFDNQDNLIYDDSVDEGIQSSLMDGTKARDELGYKAQYSIKMALKDIFNIKLDGI